jgi:hypothetical protein
LLAASLQATTPPMKTIDLGQNSDVETARQAVARSAEEWEALWRSHAPRRSRPAVDFSISMVVGVFLGQRPTAGFGVSIVGMREEQATLVVRYRETRPGPGAITAQVLTAPYHIVAVAKRAGEIKFERVEN